MAGISSSEGPSLTTRAVDVVLLVLALKCHHSEIPYILSCTPPTGDNLAHVNEHRWPPLSYEVAMEEYRKKYLEEDESGEVESGSGGDRDEGEGERNNGHKGTVAKTMKSRARKEKCKIM